MDEPQLFSVTLQKSTVYDLAMAKKAVRWIIYGQRCRRLETREVSCVVRFDSVGKDDAFTSQRVML